MYLIQAGVAIAALFNDKAKKLRRGERDAMGVLAQAIDPEERHVWFHAASLGEFEQGRPIMERLRQEHPALKILLTFFSPSGYEVRKSWQGADIICYLPIDTPTNARRFVAKVNPVAAFFIKYEFWYNYLHELQARGVPTYSVSSIFRPKQVFFRWYGKHYGRVLGCFTRFFVQNEQSRCLLASIGYDNAVVTGDTRFDRVLQIRRQAKELPVVETFTGGARHNVFVAGSSWPPDEDIFINYFAAHPDRKLIIAPHVIGEDHLKQIETKLHGRKVVRYTQAADNGVTQHDVAGAEVLIIDCFGLLSAIYGYGDIAYVGGGFGVGIHNVLEAAVWGMPVVFGPNNGNFMEAQGLLQAGGGFEIGSADDFARLMDRLGGDGQLLAAAGRSAGEYVRSRAGATDIVMEQACRSL